MMEEIISKLQDVIGSDVGDRGMKSLIVPGDLWRASELLARLPLESTVVVLSGFPCCVRENPPTETDGPPGTIAIARTALSLGHQVVIATDESNRVVFSAAMESLAGMMSLSGGLKLEVFPDAFAPVHEEAFRVLAERCNLLIACERAGPATDGNCYTMRGINMSKLGLIAPLHRLVEESGAPFIAIGDGGNELGMGKVLNKVVENPKIANGALIGCAVAADCLIAASVSNWGAWALAAGAAVLKAQLEAGEASTTDSEGPSIDLLVEKWVNKCLPSDADEVDTLERCVRAGCRDGVSGKMEATVDGMPLATSLQCLQEIRKTALLAGKR